MSAAMPQLDDLDLGVLPEKVYIGRRHSIRQLGGRGQTLTEVVVDDLGRVRPLEHHVRHSPDGFEWSYRGSGPADLALALLWDHLDGEPPIELYVHYKDSVVANLDRDGWELRSSDIAAWLGLHLGEAS